MFKVHHCRYCSVNAHANISALLCCLAMWQKAESVQIHTTSDWDARTTARNWCLSQSEALISCSRDSHAPVTLMLPCCSDTTRVWRSHHDLKIVEFFTKHLPLPVNSKLY